MTRSQSAANSGSNGGPVRKNIDDGFFLTISSNRILSIMISDTRRSMMRVSYKRIFQCRLMNKDERLNKENKTFADSSVLFKFFFGHSFSFFIYSISCLLGEELCVLIRNAIIGIYKIL